MLRKLIVVCMWVLVPLVQSLGLWVRHRMTRADMMVLMETVSHLGRGTFGKTAVVVVGQRKCFLRAEREVVSGQN